MSVLEANFQADIDAVNGIEAVQSILEVVTRTTGMGFSAVARVTPDRWITCAVRDEVDFGLKPGDELVIETTICHEIRQNHQPVVIDHVAADEVYANHHTPAMYGLQSYISVPIMLKDGRFFGTLCAIDPKPAKINNPETIGMFKLFADLIAFYLDAAEQVARSQARLREEQETAELREQFIAILGHDLRNPVAAISNVAQLLLRMPLEDRVKRLATIAQDSTYRIKGLIDNILDFASGRLGGGISLSRKNSEPVEDILNHVIAELRLIWPERVIEAKFNITEAVNCDGTRIAQLFSNLLSNALTHGQKGTQVNVDVFSDGEDFKLCVTNSGKKIPDIAMEHLFKPFARGSVAPGQQGLGLGLFISAEIARAHGGTIEVSSSDVKTCFTLQMPVKYGLV
ncbi:hypothetical protein SAMN05216464_102399 [Mucilaginibacter pineti]|uniref:histidine kinase n=1 Tax=Mucilaginibacter pineti TaxID=1391627 RepID=A0A1G6X4J2_9SPHI|nr:GAF domain-containing sensor histidine kinase [Mucilaginibacter pineti]SDD73062.1 hypothetical protein SAMN05216464_102399 [Mucilaginibacter pineti]